MANNHSFRSKIHFLLRVQKVLILGAVFLAFCCSFSFSQGNRHFLSIDESFNKTSDLEKKNSFGVELLKARPFSISSEFFQKGNIKPGDILQLNLFPGASFESVIKKVTTDVNNTTTYVTRLEGYDFAFGVISINGEDVLVSVDIPELNQKYTTRLHPTERSMHLIKLDTNNLDFLEGGHPDEDEIINSSNDKGEEQKNSSTKGSFGDKLIGDFLENEIFQLDAEIDMLVAYTPNAAAWANSNEGNINNTIANAMAWCNIAAASSKLGITFNLAYSDMVTYTESGDSGTDLARLRNSQNGHMDIIHQWRNIYYADMISLLTMVDDVGGMGYLLRKKFGEIDTGYSITRVQQASNSFTMIHEMGHNMGAHHHINQNFQPGPTYWTDWSQNLWSAGWYWLDDTNRYFCDLMTYHSGQYFNELPNFLQMGRVPVFSSPRIFHNGKPTGEPVLGDNARTLIQVKHYVSKYRDQVTSQYCAAQGGSHYYYISNVSLGGQVQESGTLPYYDFSFYKPEVTIGEALEVVVTITGADPNNQLLAWVDWDDNKVFDPESELIFSNQSGDQQFTFQISPPENTEPGPKRLRIRLNNTLGSANPNSTPCGNNDLGEVQDFSINVLPSNCVPVEIIMNPESITFCQSSGVGILQLGVSGSDDLTYSWQYLQNGVWVAVQNGIPAGAHYEGSDSNTMVISNINKVGQHHYRCNVFNCGGAISKLSQNAIIKTVEEIERPSEIIGNTQPCQGLTLFFYVEPIEGAAFKWQVPSDWQIIEDNGNYTLTVVVGMNSGEISVIATNECGESQPRSVEISVTPSPSTPSLAFMNSNTLQSSAPNGNRWYLNNGLIYGASEQTYTVTEPGNYHVRVMASDCISESSNVVNVSTVFVETLKPLDGIKIFPTLVINQLFIENQHEYETATYAIIDMAGQVVDSKLFEKRTTINTSNLDNGAYIVKVTTLQGVITKKIIKH